MRASIFYALPLAAVAASAGQHQNIPRDTTTLAAVTQISDGQIQATGPSAVANSGASAATTTEAASVAYSNPATQYLTETNSLGVVTGQPDAVTSQASAAGYETTGVSGIPAASGVATTLASVVSVGGLSNSTATTGVYTNSTATTTGKSSAKSTSDSDATSTSGSSDSSSASSAASSATSSGAAVALTSTIGPMVISLGAFGAFFAGFL
ncbi:MAG: hypothetical protein M1834_001865 [Cirrosporium novae-zelandiae]|nr:MAG: hypothetical protein M1834_001865 [Cirrosporium novae-zelandiae]